MKIDYVHINRQIRDNEDILAEVPDDLSQRRIRDGVILNGITICKILNNQEEVARGYSYTSTGDSYCRRIGRKYALKRAMADLGLSKEERTELWKRELRQ